MGLLTGKVAIVTGGGRGLGRAYALRFAVEGARVVVNSLESSADDLGGASSANLVADEIVEAGGEAVAHAGSVAEWETGQDLVAKAIDTFGRLDVLVNNAGVLRDRALVNMTEAEWDLVVDVHLKGQFVPLRFAAQHWRDRSKAGETVSAAVINTTAGAGLHGSFGQANYAAAKAGAAAMTVVAARELQRYGVRVNAIAPVARTRLLESVPGLEEAIRRPTDPTLFDEYDPDNVAPLAVYLASDTCTMTGQVLSAHGSEVALYRGWSVEERYSTDGRWTVEGLAGALAHIDPGPPPF